LHLPRFLCGKTRDAFEDYRVAELARGIDIQANIMTITHHPATVLHDVMTRPNSVGLDRLLGWLPGASTAAVFAPPLHAVNYVRQRLSQFVGVFGWNSVGPPLRFVYLAMLLAIACLETNPVLFTRGDRIVLICVFAAALVETYLAILVLDGTHRHGRYAFWSSGFAGRYMLSYSLAGLLALKQKRSADVANCGRRRPRHICGVRAVVPGYGRQVLLPVTASLQNVARPVNTKARVQPVQLDDVI